MYFTNSNSDRIPWGCQLYPDPTEMTMQAHLKWHWQPSTYCYTILLYNSKLLIRGQKCKLLHCFVLAEGSLLW